MFTGIVQGTARIARIADLDGLRRLELALPPGLDDGLAIGASVAVAGICLTVTGRPAADHATFDVMGQTLAVSRLGRLAVGDAANVERAARDGAEIGGHPLSGHVDTRATVQDVRITANNHVLRIAVPAPWMRYVFAKGYVAVDGASLTVAEAGREADGSGWFDVWLIPETLRMTTFGALRAGDTLHLEIDRSTQVVVDTVREAVAERIDRMLGPLLPVLRDLAAERGIAWDPALPDADG